MAESSPPSYSSEPNQPSTTSAIHSLSINQDHTCFAAATFSGFRVFLVDPFREIFRRTFSDGIHQVQMLFRCNILAIVGGHYPPNKVMIWDEYNCKCIGELSFRSPITSFRLRRDRIVIVLPHKVFVYNLADLRLLQQIETFSNPKGLCEVSCMSNSVVLVCLGLQKGQIRAEHYASKRTKLIMAHDSSIACIALTQDGRFVATASSKGTLIRVFNTLNGSLLQEVRRGTDKAEIHSLAFSSNAQWLAASSNRGTIHVFGLKLDSESQGDNGLHNPSEQLASPRSPMSSLSFMKGVLPKYFSSERSVAQFHLQEGTQCIVAFGKQENTVVVAGMDGSFYLCKFDPMSGGEMTQLEYHNFLKMEDGGVIEEEEESPES